MGIIRSVVCDSCGKEKGPSNHWWVVNVQNEGDRGWPKLMISPFMFEDYEWQSGDRICCGEKCALVEISRFLGDNG